MCSGQSWGAEAYKQEDAKQNRAQGCKIERWISVRQKAVPEKTKAKKDNQERKDQTMNKLDIMGKDAMNRMEDIMNSTRLNEFLHRKEEEDKKKNNILWALAIIGAVAAIAAIAYAVYRFFTPDYLEDFEDDFDDDFDDDFFEDESDSDKEEKKETEE